MHFHGTQREPIQAPPQILYIPTSDGAAPGLITMTPTDPDRPRFLTVTQAAALLQLSKVTLYRAIHDDDFPAVKIRGRFTVPGLTIDAMEKAALTTGRVIDAAEWTRREWTRRGVA
jgi:excisionase family DNA binding protein